ncbi:hypothetical protein [Spongiimicrobium sp. 3-5]|uniref:hypothetical protein n=1 Tax=Spongiimicrobium sp. 3-5 TaxID=3332596 RepID=UPI00397F6C58
MKVMDYKLIATKEFKEENTKESDPTKHLFYYMLIDHEQTTVAIKSLPVLDTFPFLDSDFFDIRIPLRNTAKRIKIYRNKNLLISHFIPTYHMRTPWRYAFK